MSEPVGGVVTVQPSGITVTAAAGEPVMMAAVRAGYAWPTICGGHGECHACFITVIEGAENLSPVLPYEADGIAQISGAAQRGGQAVRLACQARVNGHVAVFKRGVRPAAAS